MKVLARQIEFSECPEAVASFGFGQPGQLFVTVAGVICASWPPKGSLGVFDQTLANRGTPCIVLLDRFNSSIYKTALYTR
jgi:hypothetical protein